MNLMSAITASIPQERPRYFLKTWDRLIDSLFKTVEGQQSRVLRVNRAPRPRRKGGRPRTEGTSGPLQGRDGAQERGHHSPPSGRVPALPGGLPRSFLTAEERNPKGQNGIDRETEVAVRQPCSGRSAVPQTRKGREGKNAKGNSFRKTSKL